MDLFCIECGSRLTSVPHSATTNRKTGDSTQSHNKEDCNSQSAKAKQHTSFNSSSLPKHIKTPDELVESYAQSLVKENNLATCLYYNLACCYQRLGLLDEAVEYLELSSDKLEETIQFYTKQEQELVLLK